MITEQQILHFVSRQPKHMAGFKQFVHDLGIKGRDRRHLEPCCGRERSRQAGERESAGEIPSAARDLYHHDY